MFSFLILSIALTTAPGLVGSKSLMMDPDLPNGPKRVEAPITAIYAPTDYADNQNVQFMVEGEFPNNCFTLGQAKIVQRDLDVQKIAFYIDAFQTRTKCLQVRTPFLVTVDVGLLPEGSFGIYSMQDLHKRLAIIPIKKSEFSSLDDLQYAPVESAVMRIEPSGRRRIIVLSGMFTNTCMQFMDMVMPVANMPGKLIEILPLIELVDRPGCVAVNVPFSRPVAIPDEVPPGKYLLHIRTLDGGSINKIEFVKDESP